MSPEPIITVEKMTARYGDRLVLDSLSFEVQRGEIFVILGGSAITIMIMELTTARVAEAPTALAPSPVRRPQRHPAEATSRPNTTDLLNPPR